MKKSESTQELSDRIRLLEQQNADLIRQVEKLEESSDSIPMEKDKKYHTIWDQAPVGIATIDSHSGRFAEINCAYCNIVGYSKSEMLDMDFMQITHPDDLQEDLNNMERLRSGEITSFKMEKRYICKNGKIVWVSLKVVPLWEKNFEPLFHIAIVNDISEIKENERSLIENELKLKNLVSNIPGTAYQFSVNSDGNFSFLYMGENCIDLFGYTADEILADANLVFDLIPHPDADKVNEEIMESARSMKPYNIEHRVIKKNGETVWIQASSIPRNKDDGSVIWDGIGLNITERKAFEAALQLSDRRNRAILEAIPDMMFLLSSEGDILDFHAHREDETYVPHDKIIGTNIKDNMPVYFVEQCMGHIAQTLETRNPHRFEYQLPLPDGDRDYEARLVPFDESKVLAIVRNFTENKKAEKELQFQANLLNAVEQAVIAADENGHIIYWNPYAKKLYGWDEKEVLGRDITDVTVPEISKVEAAAIVEKLSKGQSWSGQFEVQRKNGTRFPALVTDSPLFDEDGNLAGAIGISTDITNLKQIEVFYRESEERFRLLVESSPISVMMVRNGKYIYGNSASVALLGFDSHDDIVGLDVLQTVAPEFHSTLKERLKRLRSGIPNDPIEIKLIRANGDIVWNRSQSVPIKINDEMTAIIFGQDITEQQRN